MTVSVIEHSKPIPEADCFRTTNSVSPSTGLTLVGLVWESLYFGDLQSATIQVWCIIL